METYRLTAQRDPRLGRLVRPHPERPAGGLLAGLMLGKHNPWHEVVFRKPAYMPAKPLRYLAVKSLLGALNGIARRIDRKIVTDGIGQ